jgi:hypothetical protein
MKRIAGSLLLAAVAAVSYAAQATKPVHVIAAPLLAKAIAPSVAADGTGGFVVSFVDAQKHDFRFATYRDGKWSAPHTIASGDLSANRADFPSLAVDGKNLAAQWSTRHGHGSAIHLARSTDGGATWSKASTPHPNVVSEFGFVSLLPTGEAVWLDGRKLKNGEEGQGDMQLRFSGDTLLDARVCDCCQTSMAMTSAGPVVAYRDRSDDEIRDISIVRRTAAGWSKPQTLHADGYKITGCPVNGPQLDARGKRVAAAWFTDAQHQPRVQVAYSDDAGATFSLPLRIDTGKAQGKVDIALLANGDAVATWLQDGTVYARRVSSNGTLGIPLPVGAANGFARLAVSKENVAVVWSAADGSHFAMLERL